MKFLVSSWRVTKSRESILGNIIAQCVRIWLPFYLTITWGQTRYLFAPAKWGITAKSDREPCLISTEIPFVVVGIGHFCIEVTTQTIKTTEILVMRFP
jgi:hypothetical protein